ncbi:protein tyrosine kinase [Fragilaria crotonensis]|nr:protein tyrosine kinase [Fragilaria crotonensis]
MERCVSSCAAYGRVCPCAARAAGRAACRATEKLYADDSKLFRERPKYDLIDADDLIIQEKLGEGGFSLVHHVVLMNRHENNKAGEQKGQHLAIKYLKRKIMVNQHSFELGAADLATEANFLATLSHPNIVKLYGVTAGSVETNVASGKECGFFIIVDLLTETLEARIKRWHDTTDHGNVISRMSHDFKEKRRQALMERLSTAAELVDAMIYLHSKNIVYRDLKPDNIGFDVNGTLKLFDFGLAKELRQKHLDGTYKLTGNTGSRRYMAPEVAMEKRYDKSVDVYSFGILLHELTSLEKPFDGYSATRHMKEVVMGGERPKLDTASTSWFPVQLHWLIQKCWSPAPSDRPTFAAVKEALVDILNESPKTPGKFRRPRPVSIGEHPTSTGSKNLAVPLPNPITAKNGDDLPDFRSLKPAVKPSRQTKSLGFLRKN